MTESAEPAPEPTADELRAQIAAMERKLKASTDYAGNPMQGYADRIKAIGAEIARVQALLNAQAQGT